MKLQFNFDKINVGANNKIPTIEIKINNTTLYTGVVVESLEVVTDSLPTNKLEILFLNKEDSDTVCDKLGKITSDMNFNLCRLIIDDNDLEELIWQGYYVTDQNQTHPSCLFFGPRGKFELIFEHPILRWILKTRNEKNHNDPNWEEDYNYYINACKILNNM